MNTKTVPSHPPSREQLLYWLHEAAEIEHHLMCCYLYAAFSLKHDDTVWSEEQRLAVAGWRRLLTSVAMEEMTHLCLVGNLMNALGAPAHMNRPAFPVGSGLYPAGFVIRLQPFSQATIEHFKFLERPAAQALADGTGFAPERSYQRIVPEGRLSPGARDYNTVGELYEMLTRSLEAFAQTHGEEALFVGDPALQVDMSLAPLQGVIAITNLTSAQRAIVTIVTQGEGAGSEQVDSHYSRFTRVGDELEQLLQTHPGFEPAWPAATNPVMNPPVIEADDRVYISHPRNARWLDIGNALYTTSLRCLLQGFDARDRNAKATWLGAAFALMRSLVPVGQGLAARPAGEANVMPHAGLTFTPLRTLARLPADSAARFVAERLYELHQRALELPVVPVAGETVETWQGVIDMLVQQKTRLLALADADTKTGHSSAAEQSASETAPAVAPIPPAVGPAGASSIFPVETVHGRNLTVHFEARRCIHSRHCVLDAPTVFKANTPGEWIHPDAISAEQLVAVAQNCPSGAIRYERHDGGSAEEAPPVNTLHVRENGPYAVHAPLTVGHHDDGLRATLCRCGQSKNKPWCDGSHVSAGFVASGEPLTGNVDALAIRDGALVVTPLRDGPLLVVGNLEICAGTGHTVARVTEARLCRCGQSNNKPFCDGSHAVVGFVANGD